MSVLRIENLYVSVNMYETLWFYSQWSHIVQKQVMRGRVAETETTFTLLLTQYHQNDFKAVISW